METERPTDWRGNTTRVLFLCTGLGVAGVFVFIGQYGHALFGVTSHGCFARSSYTSPRVVGDELSCLPGRLDCRVMDQNHVGAYRVARNGLGFRERWRHGQLERCQCTQSQLRSNAVERTTYEPRARSRNTVPSVEWNR